MMINILNPNNPDDPDDQDDDMPELHIVDDLNEIVDNQDDDDDQDNYSDNQDDQDDDNYNDNQDDDDNQDDQDDNNNNDYIYKILKLIYRNKKSISSVDSSWFKENEIAKNNPELGGDHMLIYIIQLISETSIEIMSNLRLIFNDDNQLVNISNNIQNWINTLEVNNNIINILIIKNVNTLLYWIFTMISSNKYVDEILNLHACPKEIFQKEYLLREANNNSLMLMSLYNENIRKIIINNIGVQSYTNLLNENVTIKYHNTYISVDTQFINLTVYTGSLINILKSNHIDLNTLNIKNDNLLSLLCDSINYTYKNYRNIDTNIQNNNIIPYLLLLPDNVINNLKQLKDISENDYIASIFSNQYTIKDMLDLEYFDILCKFTLQVFDDNSLINNKNIKNNNLLFILIAYDRNIDLEAKILSLTDQQKDILLNYSMLCISQQIDIPEINKLYNKLINIFNKCNKQNYLKYYIEELSEDTIKEVTTSLNYFDINNILYHNIKKYKKSYYNSIDKYLSESDMFNFIENVDDYINYYNDKINNKQLFNLKMVKQYKEPIIYFIKYLLDHDNNKLHINTLGKLYAKHITNSTNTLDDNFDNKIFDIIDEESKAYIAKLLINYTDYNINFYANNYCVYLYDKYFNNICKLTNSNNFNHIIMNMNNFNMSNNNDFNKRIILSNLISSEIKFGKESDNSQLIMDIIDFIDSDTNITPLHDMDTYKYNNCIRIIDILTTIMDQYKMNILLKLFNIDDDYINMYKIKNIYIEKIINNKVTPTNFKCILKHITFTEADVGEISILLDLAKSNKINIACLSLLLIQLISNSYMFAETIENILTKTTLIKDKFIDNPQQFYLNIIDKYRDNNNLLLFSLNKYFNVKLTIDDINNINNIFPKYIDYIINNIDIKLESNIINLISYLKDNNNICANLIAKYNKHFISTNLISINDKIKILINNTLTSRIPNIILSEGITNTTVLDGDTINNIIIMCDKYDIQIPDKLIDMHPELLHGIKNFSNDNITLLLKYVDNYDNFLKIISCPTKSNIVFNILKDKFKNTDVVSYIELLNNYNINIDKDDVEVILKYISNDSNLLKYILSNDNLIELIFNNDYYKICKLTNKLDNYTLSMINNIDITKFLKYYTLIDLTQLNKHQNPRIFGFFNNVDNISALLDKFSINLLAEIKDINGLNIYNKIIDLDIVDQFEDYNILNKIKITKDNMLVMITKLSTGFITMYYDNLSDSDKQEFLNLSDINNNKTSYYLAVYHAKLFKKLISDKVLQDKHFSINYNNETLLMKLIKESSDNQDIEPTIKWIVNNCDIDIQDCFADYNSGSVITYCLKYNKNLTKLFMSNTNIFTECINVYDNYSMICPYSDYANSGILKMNLLQIACIVDHEILAYIIKNFKKNTSYMMKETITSGNINYNILHIALFNNPESVQVLLGSNLIDMQYLKSTEQVIEKFEKVIDVQPASWYYLQQALVNKYDLTLNLDDHWYGYNYKNKLTFNKIKSVTHYILDKQELGSNKNTCNICETYANKIVFTNCHHKVCISCAVRSNKCGTCRSVIKESDKLKY